MGVLMLKRLLKGIARGRKVSYVKDNEQELVCNMFFDVFTDYYCCTNYFVPAGYLVRQFLKHVTFTTAVAALIRWYQLPSIDFSWFAPDSRPLAFFCRLCWLYLCCCHLQLALDWLHFNIFCCPLRTFLSIVQRLFAVSVRVVRSVVGGLVAYRAVLLFCCCGISVYLI